MRKIYSVFKWEISKLFSSWQKAATLFLLPAVLLMGAINVFPLLINYLSTGSLNKQAVTVVNAPDSFIEYLDNTAKSRAFTYTFMSKSDFDVLNDDQEEINKRLRKGTIICLFSTGKENINFDDEVRRYYDLISNDQVYAQSSAKVLVAYDAYSITSQTRAGQFREAIIEDYQRTLIDRLGVGSSLFETDNFNPVTDFLDYRTVANTSASRVVPGVLMIMMYYCVYSLVSDMFASERDRGFMAKLLMTPVKPKHIYIGKILAINVIVTASTCVTMLLLFFSSWLNRSNDAMSLLPFGMMLTPSELLIVLCTIPITVLLMTAICIVTVFTLNRMQDITVNLQLPLVYFLGEFFLQMVRSTRPVTFEYFIPLHNSLALIGETFMSPNKAWHTILIYLMNISIAIVVFTVTFRKEEQK